MPRTSSAPTVCVVGSGAREHALAHVLGRTAHVVATPGNPGIDGETTGGFRMRSVPTPPEEVDADLYVIGPEQPLVAGLADRLRALGRRVFGPGADGAAIEGSKEHMKRLAESAGVPTARWAAFGEAGPATEFLASLPGPYVVKTDGLAAGKGVLVTADLAEAEADVAAKLSGASFGDAGRRVVVEEYLSGDELSLFAVCDGTTAVAMAPARDYKRVGTGDVGPNTGGMGACSPAPGTGEAAELVTEAMERIVIPSLGALGESGVDYRGLLYAGLMACEDGLRLVEFNVRFGDPETEVVLPRFSGDLFAVLLAAAEGDLASLAAGTSAGSAGSASAGSGRPGPVGSGPGRAAPVLRFSDEAAVCVVAAAPGYPEAPVTGAPIDGIAEAARVRGVTVFHAGTRRDADGVLRSAGGRVLCLSALGRSLGEARERVYEAVERVGFEGMQYRTDIGSGSTTGPVRAAAGGAVR